MEKEGFNNQPKLRLFVINMDKDKTRLDNMMKYYKNSDLSQEPIGRFPAVVGKKVPVEKFLTSDALSDLHLIEKNGYRTHHHSLTRGGLGCFLSHYSLAKQLLNDKKNIDGYLIFEDDTSFLPNTYEQIQNYLKTIPENWDMALFYTIRAIGRSENEKFNRIKSFWGMNCYIINRKGAEKFVNEVNKTKIDGQVDCYLSRMIQQDKLNVYSTKKHVVSSNSIDTNIQIILKPIKNIDPYDYKGYKV
tara:strand:+ start:320 stop:1057 length:738 start_codon:yes stop_codon:yes gene_type:complete